MKPATKVWVAKAEQDLEAAKCCMQKAGPPVYDAVCFHCQQCAEKYMKAVLTERGVHFPKTHDLKELVALISTVVQGWSAALTDLNLLAPAAVEYRYPGSDATLPEATEALEACERLRTSLLSLL